MAPFSTHAALPSTPGEWQPSHTNVPYSRSPLRIVAALAVCAGGRGTGGITSGGVGKGTSPPSLKASSRVGPRLDCGVAMVLPGANSREPEPHPTAVSTYCSPCAVKVSGTESTAEPVATDHSFLPLSAAYASNSP